MRNGECSNVAELRNETTRMRHYQIHSETGKTNSFVPLSTILDTQQLTYDSKYDVS